MHNLLPLLKLKLNGRLDAVAGVVVGLLQGQLHQVFVVCSCHVPTDENDDIGQNLRKKNENTKIRPQEKLIHKYNIYYDICNKLIIFQKVN